MSTLQRRWQVWVDRDKLQTYHEASGHAASATPTAPAAYKANFAIDRCSTAPPLG